MNLPELSSTIDNEHQILGSEFCSGYTDTFGNWNNGFYCPQSESKVAIYCCGTPNFKYCCMHRNPKSTFLEPIIISNNNNDIRSPVPLIVSMCLGISLFTTLVCCIVYYYFSCPCKRKLRTRSINNNNHNANNRIDNRESGAGFIFRDNQLYEGPNSLNSTNSTLLNMTPEPEPFMEFMPATAQSQNSYSPYDFQSGLNYYYYPTIPEQNFNGITNTIPQGNCNANTNTNAHNYNMSGSGAPRIPSISTLVNFHPSDRILCPNSTSSSSYESTCLNIPGTVGVGVRKKIEDKNNSSSSSSTQTQTPMINLHGPLVSSHENIETVPNPIPKKQDQHQLRDFTSSSFSPVHSTIKTSSTNTNTNNNKKVQFELSNQNEKQHWKMETQTPLDFKTEILSNSLSRNRNTNVNKNNNCTNSHSIVETHRISL